MSISGPNLALERAAQSKRLTTAAPQGLETTDVVAPATAGLTGLETADIAALTNSQTSAFTQTRIDVMRNDQVSALFLKGPFQGRARRTCLIARRWQV